MLKKIITAAFALTLVVGEVSFSASDSFISNAKAIIENADYQSSTIQEYKGFKYVTFESGKTIIISYDGEENDIIVPSTINGTTIDYVSSKAFDMCYNISSITFSDKLEMVNVWESYEDEYFDISYSTDSEGEVFLEDFPRYITVKAESTSNIAKIVIKNADYYDLKLEFTDFITSDDYSYYVTPDQKVFLISYNGTLSDVSVPDTIDNLTVKFISNRAFKNCKNIKSITIPKNVSFKDFNVKEFIPSNDYYPNELINIVVNSDNITFKISKDYSYEGGNIIGIIKAENDIDENSAYEEPAPVSEDNYEYDLGYQLYYYDLVDISDTSTSKSGFGKKDNEKGYDDEKPYEYNGKAHTLDSPNALYNGTFKLIENTDYKIEYKNNINAGTATQIIKGLGKYKGEKTHDFNISKQSLESCTISLENKNCTYTGKAIKPAIVARFNDLKLKEGIDYTVTYSDNIKIGTATAVIKGIGNYEGSRIELFNIEKAVTPSVDGSTKKSIKKATVSGLKNKYYTGKAITQTPVVKLGSKTLKKGTDYTVTFKNNKAIGTATVTIKGKGNYSGTVSKTFKIVPKKTTLKTATSPKKGQLKVTYTKQTNITGYQITYALDKNFTKSKASKSSAKLSKTISGLKSGKTYYVKVRTYKTVNGTKYYSGYSAVKKIKVK